MTTSESRSALPVVQSRSNPLFKRLRMLAGAAQKQRREGVAILEGVHLADAYLQALRSGTPAVTTTNEASRHATAREAMALEQVVVSQSAAFRDDIQGILARIQTVWSDRVTIFDDALFEQVSPVTDGGVGILLLIAAPHTTLSASYGDASPQARSVEGSTHALLAGGADGATITENCVILDGVQDAGNVGSILRSAAAAGVTLAFCLPGTATVWSTKVLRAAMGAHFVMRIVEQVPPEGLAPLLGIPIVVTDLHGAASLYDTNLRRPLAWVMGNEGAGVSPFWRERADLRVTIPQYGRIESLNVAAAAAVCLFEQTRQQRSAAQ